MPSGWSLVGTGSVINNLSSGFGMKKIFLFRDGSYIDPISDPTGYPINAGEGFWVKKEISVTVANGWNLLSVPVNMDLVQPSVFGDADYVYAYRNQTYEQNPSNLRAGEGFWVKNSKVDRTVTFEGNSYAPALDKVTADGWSLLGTGKSMATFGLNPFYKIWVYRNDKWLNPNDNNLAEIKAGEGVWVKRR